MEALCRPEIVRQIVLAAFNNEHPGCYAMRRALRKAEQLLKEIHEAEVEEMAAYYEQEMTGDAQ